MTLDAFLDWERRQEMRYEFDGFAPVAMNGGTLHHIAIGDNVLTALHERLKSPCRVFGSTTKIIVAGHVRYPDVTVTRSPIDG